MCSIINTKEKSHIIVLGLESPSSSEFNERTGEEVIVDGEPLPLIGFCLEW